MTKESMREIAEQAIRELNLAGAYRISAVKRPPYEGDPTWWIDFAEAHTPWVFQVFVPLDKNPNDEWIKGTIKRQLQERSFGST